MSRRLAAIVGTLLLLGGCVAVPTSGPVERQSPAQQQPNPGVEIAPVPPAQGASPGLIVEGFLHAMATYQPGYEVARQFLTSAASEQWHPESGVEIYAGGYPPEVSESGVVLTAPLVGTLNNQGSFIPTSTQYHHDFGLVRDAEGQWRISRPPRGLLISQSLFGSTWVRSDVCFWDASGNWLVPDPRFVQKGNVGMVSTVRAVLAGPATAQQAYRPPLEVALDVSVVTLNAGGVATVELTGDVDQMDADDRRRLTAELVWSLSSLEGVTGLRVRGNGSLWDVGGTAGTVTTADFEQGAPVVVSNSDQAFLIREGAVQRANWDEPGSEPQGVGGELNRLSAVAARLDGQVLGVITDGGTKLRTVSVREGGNRVELNGARFIGVRWTRQGEVWCVVDRDRAGRLRMIRDGRETPVDTTALPPGRIGAFAPAPDGVRVALVIEDRGRSSLGVAAMVRTDAGIEFVGWRNLSDAAWTPGSQQALDVGWSGPATLLVLLGGGTLTRVVSVDSEGAVATDVGPGDAPVLTQIAVSTSERAVLRGADGQTWRFVNEFSWEPWLAKVQQVSLP